MNKKTTNGPRLNWVEYLCRYCAAAEHEGARMAHPHMQGLVTAVHLVGRAVKDDAWMKENDPGRELEQALKTLVGITTPKPCDV